MDETPQEIELYRCGRCQGMMPASCFYRSSHSHRGFLYRCKECQKRSAKESYQTRLRAAPGKDRRAYRSVAELGDKRMQRVAAEIARLAETVVICDECGEAFTCLLIELPKSAIFCPECIKRRVAAVKAERQSGSKKGKHARDD